LLNRTGRRNGLSPSDRAASAGTPDKAHGASADDWRNHNSAWRHDDTTIDHTNASNGVTVTAGTASACRVSGVEAGKAADQQNRHKKSRPHGFPPLLGRDASAIITRSMNSK
jgi:hypothetical protein